MPRPFAARNFADSKHFFKSATPEKIALICSKCKFVWGDPITIPASTRDDEIEGYKAKLEDKINYCIKIAKSKLDA